MPRRLPKFPLSLLLLMGSTALAAEPQKPRLVVQITVDQLRADLLQRYRAAFTGGFKRLLDRGWSFPQAEVTHGITVSFPGHATLSTGMTPARHGLTANEWWQLKDGRWQSVSVVEDRRYRGIGNDDRESVSPANLVATTLADWVKRSDPAAKTISLSSGNTVALAYGGQRPDATYWYDGASGRFVTSSYYEARPRPWIDEFHAREFPGLQPREWSLSVPPPLVSMARPDASPYEAGGKNNRFPHEYAVEARREVGEDALPYGRWFASTGLKDAALFALAKRAIVAERLGQRDSTDYLAVLPDTLDSVGHKFGPNSLEQMDALLRLDRALGDFLDHLDRVVGAGAYVVALSADHGVADPPEEGNGRRVRAAEIEALLDEVENLAKAHRGSRGDLVAKIVDRLKQADFIGDAYDEGRLSKRSDDDRFAEAFKQSFLPGKTTDFPLWSSRDRAFHPARYGIAVRFKDGFVFDYAVGIHGSPYEYDRQVPIIFYGAGVRACQSSAAARTIDVAPTLAALGGISAPNRTDGRALSQSSSCTTNP